MPTVRALIQVNGVDGSNDDLPLNVLVRLNNNGLGGETSFLWCIVDQPGGASDALTSTTIQNPTFTPRKEGTYLISLVVDQGLPTECQDSAVVGIRQVKSRVRVPAANETIQLGVKGWATTGNNVIQKLDSFVGDSGTLLAVATGAMHAGQVCYLGDLATIKTGLPGEETLPNAYLVAAHADLLQTLYIVEGTPTSPGGAAVLGDIVVLRFNGAYRASLYPPIAGYAPVYCDAAGAINTTYTDGARIVGMLQCNGAGMSTLIWGVCFTASRGFVVFGSHATQDGLTVKWLQPSGGGSNADTDELQMNLGSNVVLRNLRVHSAPDGPTGVGNQIFTLYDNGAPTSLQVTLLNGASSVEDTTHVSNGTGLISLQAIGDNGAMLGAEDVYATLEVFSAT